jgi:hypothetical protein
MQHRLICSIAAVLAFSPIILAQTGKLSEAEKNQASTPALSHDLSGVWMQYPSGAGPGIPGMNAVDEKTRPPLTAWGQAKFDAAKPVTGPRAVPGEEGNPSLRCEPDSPPRLLILPNPFEIVQIPGRVFMFFEEYHAWRTIWADGRSLPKDPDPTWLGYSVGKWEGDTFVVDTIGFNDKVWVDGFGNPRSEQMHLTERYRRLNIGFNDKVWVDGFGNPRSEQMHLTERYRRLNHDTLEMQIIMDDPEAYTKPWISPPKLHKLEPGWELAEWFCVQDEHNTYDETVRKPAGVSPAHK